MRYDAFVRDAESLGDSARYNVRRLLNMSASPELGSRTVLNSSHFLRGN